LTLLRHALSDAHYAIIEPLLPTNDRPGHPWKCHRSVIDGILWILHTGAPWRDLPRATYGPWQTVYERFNRWSKDGTWGRLLEALHVRLDQAGKIDWDLFCIDGSSIRASRDAGGASPTDGTPAEPADHALGRSRGGDSTKIHFLCDGRGHPLHFHLTAGQAHETTAFVDLMIGADERVTDGDGGPVAWPVALAGDKGDRADWLDEYLIGLGIVPVIPSKANSTGRPGRWSSTSAPTGGGASWRT
jgi:transposase